MVIRGTEKLVGALGRDVVGYLNRFPILESLDDIAAWKRFCDEHPSRDLQSECSYYDGSDSYLQPTF